MNFSECFQQTSDLVAYSPDGNFVANAVQYRLVVRDAETLQVARMFTCVDVLQFLQWSPDSQFILCALYDRGIIQIWNIEHSEWNCKIDEGSAGLIDACWSSDSRHILTTWQFYLRITVWSLAAKTVSYIKYPKNCPKNKSFSRDGKFLALLERRDFQDCISIFNVNSNWQLHKHFQCETEDANGIEWIPDGSGVVVWESLIPNNLIVYDMQGVKKANFQPTSSTAGFRCLQFDKSASLLAAGSFDGRLFILNTVTWKALCIRGHETEIDSVDTIVYRQENKTPDLSLKDLKSIRQSMQSHYALVDDKKTELPLKEICEQTEVATGISRLGFSHNSQFLYTVNDAHPQCLFIWKISEIFKLHSVLIHKESITDIAWDPNETRLALATTCNNLFMWFSRQEACASEFHQRLVCIITLSFISVQ